MRETSVPCMTMCCRPCMMVVNLFINMTQNKKSNSRPGWNEHVAMYHTEACEAYKLWITAGKPKQGSELEH